MLDVDRFIFADKELKERFNVESLPVIVVYKNGVEIARVPGLDGDGQTRLIAILEQALSNDAPTKQVNTEATS